MALWVIDTSSRINNEIVIDTSTVTIVSSVNEHRQINSPLISFIPGSVAQEIGHILLNIKVQLL